MNNIEKITQIYIQDRDLFFDFMETETLKYSFGMDDEIKKIKSRYKKLRKYGYAKFSKNDCDSISIIYLYNRYFKFGSDIISIKGITKLFSIKRKEKISYFLED